MAQEKLSLRKIREILRLKHEVGLSNRAIARACCISNSTVGDYVVRARRAGLVWPLAKEQTEEELYKQLFPEVNKPQVVERPVPDWEEVHRDLARQGVTLQLLWQEYREKYPDGYGRSQFCEHYQRWNQSHQGAQLGVGLREASCQGRPRRDRDRRSPHSHPGDDATAFH